jgi:hypothetical protein
MSKRKLQGKCSVCARAFTRIRPRQQVCCDCYQNSRFKCEHCDEPYTREDEIPLCNQCLKKFKPDPGEVSRAYWSEVLNKFGLRPDRGLYPARAPLTPFEKIPDRPRIGPPESAVMFGPELMDFFLRAPLSEVCRRTNLHHQEVSRLRAQMDEHEDENLVVAHQAMGTPSEEREIYRFYKHLAEARSRSARRELEASAVESSASSAARSTYVKRSRPPFRKGLRVFYRCSKYGYSRRAER